jgi:hypothetical protein
MGGATRQSLVVIGGREPPYACRLGVLLTEYHGEAVHSRGAARGGLVLHRGRHPSGISAAEGGTQGGGPGFGGGSAPP